MTPLDPASIRYWINVRTRRREICYAVSADGAWAYEHLDHDASPWRVWHLPTGRCWDDEPSLAQARRGTASGWTLAQLDAPPTPPPRRCQHVSPFTRRLAGCMFPPTPDSDRCAQHPRT